MGITVYLLGSVLVTLACMYWARANGQLVELWGIAAFLTGPLALLVMLVLVLKNRRRAPARPRPTAKVLPPVLASATFSAAAGPLGGYRAPGEKAPVTAKKMPLYLPLVLNGACLLVLLVLSWGNEGSFVLLALPLVVIGNSLLFLRAFAQRADGPAFLFLLPAVAGIWFVLQTLDSLHR